MSEVLGQCPVCTGELVVVREECTHCGTALEGRFTLPRLLRLAPEQLRFVELFVRCRGVIRDMEQELGVSYPTVRSRLDDVINSLGLAAVDEQLWRPNRLPNARSRRRCDVPCSMTWRPAQSA